MYEGSFTAADMGADLKGKTLQDLIAAFQVGPTCMLLLWYVLRSSARA